MPGVLKKSNKSNTISRKPRAKKNTRRVTKKKGGMKNISDLNVLPPDITRSIQGFVKPALTNTSIHVAVRGYLAGGKDKDKVVSKYGDIINWDVSKVTDMNEMFYEAKNFNQPLTNWDVSNVTNMIGMFAYALNFNQSLNKWNVSKVTNMSKMFYEATNFNQSLNKWNVSKVTNMRGMFADAHKFNQPLDNWDVSNVTDMTRMFDGATNFNQPINNWDVSKVTNMTRMFQGATKFNPYFAPIDKLVLTIPKSRKRKGGMFNRSI